WWPRVEHAPPAAGPPDFTSAPRVAKMAPRLPPPHQEVANFMSGFMRVLAIGLSAAMTLIYGQTATLDAGTTVEVRTIDTIDVKKVSEGRSYTGTVNKDVRDASGRVATPKGSPAEMAVRKISDRELALDLNAIDVAGRRYTVASDASTQTGAQKEGIGKNK